MIVAAQITQLRAEARTGLRQADHAQDEPPPAPGTADGGGIRHETHHLFSVTAPHAEAFVTVVSKALKGPIGLSGWRRACGPPPTEPECRPGIRLAYGKVSRHHLIPVIESPGLARGLRRRHRIMVIRVLLTVETLAWHRGDCGPSHDREPEWITRLALVRAVITPAIASGATACAITPAGNVARLARMSSSCARPRSPGSRPGAARRAPLTVRAPAWYRKKVPGLGDRR